MDKRFTQYDELDLPKVAEEVLKQWEAEDTFGQSLELRKDAPPFVFYEGPPSANGLPGIHHVMARTIKDIFCRYQTQKGHRVDRKAGWDTHGLPIELGVEKELGITKEDIGKKISIEEYNAACKKAVMRYTDVWNDLTKRIGFWLDLEKPYVTYHTQVHRERVAPAEAAVRPGPAVQGLHHPALLARGGHRPFLHELNQPGTYKPVKDTSVVAQFKVKRDASSEWLFKDAFGDEVFILAWTTTPWTLPSNCALTVGPKLDYVRVKTFNPYTHAAADRGAGQGAVERYFKEDHKDASFEDYKKDGKNIPWSIDDEFYGHQLEGIRYEQLLPYAQPEGGDAFKVIGGDFVTTEDGTGVVHTAPSFGADDHARGAPAQHRHAHAGGPARALQTGGDRLRGRVREGRIPQRGRAGRRSEEARPRQVPQRGRAHRHQAEDRGPRLQGGEVRAQLPALLAHRQARALLPARQLVRARHREEGPLDRAQQDHHLEAREHRHRPLRQLAGEPAGLEPLAFSATGASRCPSGAPRMAMRNCASVR
jgi:isoleucyl-tRNA synthetase